MRGARAAISTLFFHRLHQRDRAGPACDLAAVNGDEAPIGRRP